MTLVPVSKFDPVLMDPPDLDILFNEVAAIVAPVEGVAYAKAVEVLRGKPPSVPAERTVLSCCYNHALSISIQLMNHFNGLRQEADSADLRAAYGEIKSFFNAEYEAQRLKEDNLSPEQRRFNAMVDVYAGTARTMVERLEARLP